MASADVRPSPTTSPDLTTRVVGYVGGVIAGGACEAYDLPELAGICWGATAMALFLGWRAAVRPVAPVAVPSVATSPSGDQDTGSTWTAHGTTPGSRTSRSRRIPIPPEQIGSARIAGSQEGKADGPQTGSGPVTRSAPASARISATGTRPVAIPAPTVEAGEAVPAALIQVLVIDADADLRQRLAAKVLPWGIEVHGVSSVPEAALHLRVSHQGGMPMRGVLVADAGFLDDLTSLLERFHQTLAHPPVRVIGLGLHPSANRPLPTTLAILPAEVERGSLLQALTASGPVEPPTVGRVLVVEDNDINWQISLAMCNHLGLQADVAMNGRDALQALQTTPYGLVLMDCQMPVMDGITATRLWRQHEAEHHLKAIPIIALTANAFTDDRDRCLAAGMDDHLAKPVNMDDLRRCLETWLPGFRHPHPPTTRIVRRPSPVKSAPVMAGALPAKPEDLLFDPRVLADLRDEMGPEGGPVIQGLITDFLAGVTEQIQRLAAAIAAGDGARVAAVAHRLRGQCLQLGLNRLVGRLRTVEIASATSLDGAAEHLAAIREIWTETQPYVEAQRSAQV